jgi:hypothetical protein
MMNLAHVHYPIDSDTSGLGSELVFLEGTMGRYMMRTLI